MAETARSRRLRILAIDGGGIRGVIPAMMLEQLERHSARPLHEMFDLFAGTSTGALIALALVAPNARGRTDIASELAQYYRDQSPAVFEGKRLQKVPVLGVNRTPYDRKALADLAGFFVGDVQLAEATTRVMVPAYDLAHSRLHWFKSWDSNPRASSFSMHEVAMAASAAPTYFAPLSVDWTEPRKTSHVFIDGGIFANNPALAAWTEVADPGGQEPLVVSLGTGDVMSPDVGKEPADWGLREWGQRGLQIVFDAVSEQVDDIMRAQLSDDAYHRIQVRVPHGFGEMDDPDSVDELGDLANKRIKSLGDPYFQDLAADLAGD